MPLNIIIFAEPLADANALKKTLSAKDQSLLILSKSVFLYQINESSTQILKKVNELGNLPVTIFESPSTGWATSIKNEKITQWIQEALNDDVQPCSIQF